MDQTTHTLPPGLEVMHLTPQRGTREVALTPDVEVLCIHRGAEPFEDMFDSVPFLIPPGYFKTTYGAALHFRARAVVPGSRNPETQRQASFIAIIGVVEIHGDGSFTVIKAVDRQEEWAVFSAEEQVEYAGKLEALDREGMVNPIDRDVTLAGVGGLIAGKKPGPASRVKGSSGGNVSTSGGRAVGGSSKRAPGGVDLTATDPSVMQAIPASENKVLQEAQKASAVAAAEGHRPGR